MLAIARSLSRLLRDTLLSVTHWHKWYSLYFFLQTIFIPIALRYSNQYPSDKTIDLKKKKEEGMRPNLF